MRTAVTGVRTVGVPVTDQDEAIEFYVGTLGLAKRLDVPLGQFGGRWVEVAPPGAGTSLALVPAAPDAPAGVATGVRLATADAGALHDELAANGADVDEVLRWEGVPAMFTLRDPFGNSLQLVEQ